nr:O-antigen ligase family protein [Cohnella luojiensis]
MAVTFLLVPTIISFVMSLSRGAFIVAFPVLVVTLLLLPFRKQLVLSCLGLSALIMAIPLSRLMVTIGGPLQMSMDVSSSLRGWAILFGSAIVYAALATLIIRSISDWMYDLGKREPRDRWIIPSIFVLTATVGVLILVLKPHWISFLPDLLEQRLLKINGKENSMLERFAFYRDSIKMWQHQPIFGYGGSAWKTLVYTYQSNPYASILAHSFIFQTLVETGMFGILSFVLLLVWILIRVFRNRSRLSPEYGVMIIILAVLIMTSAIDFNMNFGYLICMLFIVMGMVSTIGRQASAKIKPVPVRLISNAAKPIAHLLFAIFLLYQSVNLIQSHSSFNAAQNAMLQKKPESVTFSWIDDAIKHAKDHPEYSAFKVMALLMRHDGQPDEVYLEESVKTLGQIKLFEKQNITLIEAELALYKVQNRIDEAQELVMNNLDVYPWNTILYDQAILGYFTKGFIAKQEHNLAKAEQYFHSAVDIFNRFDKQKNKLSQLPMGQAKGLPFKLAEKSMLALGQIYAMLHDWATAEKILKPFVSQIPKTRDELNANRWYEAVLFSQGNSPDAVKQLRKADPDGGPMMKELLAFIQEGYSS